MVTAVHVLAVLADSYVHFSLVNVLVPLAGDWHPLAVALGIAGMYLLLAVELTSLARPRVPRRLWWRVHYAGFAVYLTTTVHGLAAGTDGRARPSWSPTRSSPPWWPASPPPGSARQPALRR